MVMCWPDRTPFSVMSAARLLPQDRSPAPSPAVPAVATDIVTCAEPALDESAAEARITEARSAGAGAEADAAGTEFELLAMGADGATWLHAVRANSEASGTA